jgi:hypothetical protein
MALYNKNYMNGYNDDVSMLPLDKQAGVLEGRGYQILIVTFFIVYYNILFSSFSGL